jgi:anhydro-N-acetylmuramic acid kinase
MNCPPRLLALTSVAVVSLAARHSPLPSISMRTDSKLVLGLMSGTSADGIDVALAQISGAPPNLNANLLNHTSINFPPALRKEILRVAEQQPIPAGDLSQLNFRLGEVFAESVLTACKRFRIPTKRIALLGSHGQTIFHQGQPVPYLGRPTASTLQIGEPSIIAARTGITTVADFRPADIALGGQGAPLVPYADYLLYRHAKFGRVASSVRLRHWPSQHADRRARRALHQRPPALR